MPKITPKPQVTADSLKSLVLGVGALLAWCSLRTILVIRGRRPPGCKLPALSPVVLEVTVSNDKMGRRHTQNP
jgi:hypothetical protein